MRTWLLVGACAVVASGSVSAQFASDRTPAPNPFGGTTPKATVPELPGGVKSLGGGPAPRQELPGGLFLPDPMRKEPLKPVASALSSAPLPEDLAKHAVMVTAEHGGWMICVKSYSGPDSRVKAAMLAKEIRETHKTNALLFERNAEERQAEQAQVDAQRKAELEKARPFEDIVEQERRKAAAAGMGFNESRPTLKISRPYHETPEQWAVLIGGFKTGEDAKAALAKVKLLPTPKEKEKLCDVMAMGIQRGEKDGQKAMMKENETGWGYVNPYEFAMVVTNPKAPRASLEEKNKLEPYVVRLNEGVPNTLLTVKKPWTLCVKSYTMPTRRVTGDGDKSVFDKFGSKKGSTAADLLMASAAEAEMLTAALRNKEMKPRPYESYVLHHQFGSVVTVGAFDTPDDPELMKLQQELLGITFEMKDKDKKPVAGPDGKPLVQRLFDGVNLYPVPKH